MCGSQVTTTTTFEESLDNLLPCGQRCHRWGKCGSMSKPLERHTGPGSMRCTPSLALGWGCRGRHACLCMRLILSCSPGDIVLGVILSVALQVLARSFLVGGQPQSSTCKGHEGCCSGKQCMQCAGRGQLYPMWWRHPGGYAGIHCRMLAILGPHVCVLRALPSAYMQACLSPFQDELLPLWLHRWRSRRPTSGETRSLAALSFSPLLQPLSEC